MSIYLCGIFPVLIIYEWQNVIYFGRSMLLPVKWQVEICIKFDTYLQDLRLILTKRLLYLIGFAANTGNSSISHTFKLFIKKAKMISIVDFGIVHSTIIIGNRQKNKKKCKNKFCTFFLVEIDMRMVWYDMIYDYA